MEHYLFITRMFDFSQIKVQAAAFYGSIVSLIMSFISDIIGISFFLFGMLIIVMVTDYITGLAASRHEEKVLAKKENRKPYNVFKSKKGLGWVFKLGSYMVFLAISFALQKQIISYGIEFMQWPMKLVHYYILIHIFYWELKSVDENFERLGYQLRILKLADSLFDLIRVKIKKRLD